MKEKENSHFRLKIFQSNSNMQMRLLSKQIIEAKIAKIADKHANCFRFYFFKLLIAVIDDLKSY